MLDLTVPQRTFVIEKANRDIMFYRKMERLADAGRLDAVTASMIKTMQWTEQKRIEQVREKLHELKLQVMAQTPRFLGVRVPG